MSDTYSFGSPDRAAPAPTQSLEASPAANIGGTLNQSPEVMSPQAGEDYVEVEEITYLSTPSTGTQGGGSAATSAAKPQHGDSQSSTDVRPVATSDKHQMEQAPPPSMLDNENKRQAAQSVISA